MVLIDPDGTIFDWVFINYFGWAMFNSYVTVITRYRNSKKNAFVSDEGFRRDKHDLSMLMFLLRKAVGVLAVDSLITASLYGLYALHLPKDI
jgi:hypothetical protein